MEPGELWVPQQLRPTRHFLIFSVAISSINRLLVCGPAAVLALRKARSPGWARKHADMHLRKERSSGCNVCASSAVFMLLLCVTWIMSAIKVETTARRVFMRQSRSCRRSSGWPQAQLPERGLLRTNDAAKRSQTIHVCLRSFLLLRESQNNGTCARERGRGGGGASSWVAASVAAAAGGSTGVKPSLFETGLTPPLRCGLRVWGPEIFWPFPHVRLDWARDLWPTAETSDVPPSLWVLASDVLLQKEGKKKGFFYVVETSTCMWSSFRLFFFFFLIRFLQLLLLSGCHHFDVAVEQSVCLIDDQSTGFFW